MIIFCVRNCLDNVLKDLQKEGLGHNLRKVDVISSMMEEEMWNCGVLGRNSTVKLLETLVYMLGLNLG